MAVIEAIQTTYVETTDVASVTFGSIPATYEHLQLRISPRTDQAYGYVELSVQFGVGGVIQTGTNYYSHWMAGYNTTETAGGGTARDYFKLFVGSGAHTDAAQYAGIVADILDYANTNKNTTISGIGGTAHGVTTPFLAGFSGQWDGTDAIDTLKIHGWHLTGDLLRGTEISLYGLKSA
tara:strand:+ start:98 stop:634 length:537 start_codon:yes stop_codon:yes gene_type:complete